MLLSPEILPRHRLCCNVFGENQTGIDSWQRTGCHGSAARVISMMNIGTNASAVGGHLVGWRHRDSWHPSVTQLENVVLTARIAERGKLDLIFLADGNG